MNISIEYEQNFPGWLDHHLMLLRQGRLTELDVTHLIEELEGMANRDRNELVSRFIILIAHLLKWPLQLQTLAEQWDNFQGRSWRASIIEQRIQIEFQLENTPSLKAYLSEAMVKAYPKAVALAATETKLNPKVFPARCPYHVEQLLDRAFYPA